MAEYSKLAASEAATLLALRGLQLRSFSRIAGGAANTSYVAETDQSPVVITVLDNRGNLAPNALVEVLERLLASGVRVDGIVRNLDNTALSVTANGTSVIVRPFIRGCHPTGSRDDAVRIGEALGTIHRSPSPPGLPVDSRALPSEWRELLGPGVPADLTVMLERAAKVCSTDEWRALPRVFVHGDLFPDNMLIEASTGQLVVLDWETASVDPAVVDIGIAAVALAGIGVPRRDALNALLDGYGAVRQLSDGERAQVQNGFFVGAAVLAFHRYRRHNVTHPDSSKAASFRPLVGLVASP